MTQDHQTLDVVQGMDAQLVSPALEEKFILLGLFWDELCPPPKKKFV